MSKIAIVTGSDSGIGEATAVALAEAGYDVGVTFNRDEAEGKETAAKVTEAGRSAEVRHLDLSRLPEAADTIDDLIQAMDGVDVFVNNSGTSKMAPFLDLSYDDWRDTLSIDLDGAFLCAQRAARHMVSRGDGGRIINVTSVHEHVPLPESSAYCAAKGGLGLLTKVMALELAEHGITVNAIAPGEIATPMTGNDDSDPCTERRPGIPAGRPGDANEIASAVVYLASDQAAYATGASFVIDGGLLLMAAVRNQE
jgi:NAD(P)-dependent dehydrogenase (short-subunit alcohol dehydrogenase family)